jgi:hypothetical protein
MPLILNGTTGVSGVDGTAGTPAVQGGDANTGTFYPAADTVGLATNGTERARVSSDGTFRVKGAGTAGSTDAFLVDGGAPASAARINSSGELLVGTTTGGARVVASTSSGTSLYIDASSTNDAVMRWTASGVSKALNYWTPGTDRLYFAVGATGGLYLANGGTSWTSASDERVKDIIEPIENAVSKANSLRTVIGKYKADATNKRRAFLIAQDVKAVFPEAVDDGDENELGLQYADVIPLAIAAIKELSAELNEAKARIAALEAK